MTHFASSPFDAQFGEISLEFNRHIVNLLDCLSALSDLAGLSINDLGEAELLKQALAALMSNQDMERCSIFLLGDGDDGDGDMLTNLAGLDWDDMLRGLGQSATQNVPLPPIRRASTPCRLGEGIMGEAAASGAIVHCRSCADDPRFTPFGTNAAPAIPIEGALLCVPISCEQQVLGVLNVFHPEPGFFNMWHERLLLLFCQGLGRLLLNHRYTHHLRQLVASRTREITLTNTALRAEARQREATQEDLADQRNFLQSVIDSAPEPIMVIGHDYRLIMANRPARENAPDQFAAGELSGELLCHRISHHRDSPCDGSEHPCPLRLVLECGESTSVVHRHFNAAGEPRLVELLVSPLRDKYGQVIGIIESARDITERSAAEVALREARDYAENLIRSTNTMVVELDPAGNLRVFNPAAEEITGYTLDELKGRNWFEALVPRNRFPKVWDEFERLVAGGMPDHFENPILTKEGDERYISWTNSLLRQGDTITGIVSFGMDITLQKLSEASLRESEERFRTIADYTYDWEYWQGPGGEFLYISPACKDITGYTQAEFISDPELVYRIIHPDDRHLMDGHRDNIHHEDIASIDFRIVRKDGGERWIAHGCRAVHGRDGRFMGRRASNRDITAKQQAELEYKTIVQTANDGYLMLDTEGRILDANEAYCKMSGFSHAELTRMRSADLAPQKSLAEIAKTMAEVRGNGQIRFDSRHRCSDGHFIDVEISASFLDVRGGVLIVFVHDVTERVRTELQIRQLAYYDTLTNLPNRRLLADRMQQALEQAKRFQRSLAVMFLDLDRFKQINDTLGHDAGDELLRQVATRLNNCVRSADTVARTGGDEFVIILSEIANPRDAALVAEKIIASFARSVPVGDHLLNVTTSIGIAIYPVGGSDDVQELMKKADRAMYAAKEAGRNGYRFFED